MSKLQMKLYGDLILREKCAPVEAITPEILTQIDQMVELLEEQIGAGLAAPQVGIPLRFFIMKEAKSREDFSTAILRKMINPRIISKSEKTCTEEEGCLSILRENDRPVYADVERPETIVVEWTDENGTRQEREFSGISARAFQHELDHLDGILFIDHLPPVKREIVMKKVRKRK